MEVLDRVYHGNTVRAYVVALAVTLAIVVLVRLLLSVVRRRVTVLATRTSTGAGPSKP